MTEMTEPVQTESPSVRLLNPAIEVGRSSLPPERLADVADILGVDRQDFSKTYLRWTNPWVYQLLLEPTDKKLQKELERIQPRVGLDVFKKPARR